MNKENLQKKEKSIWKFQDVRIVLIPGIRFTGKRKIGWEEVEQYLRRYVGKCYKIDETKVKVYIGNDFADEYAGSKDTARLKGALAKAKANASQAIPELIKTAIKKSFQINMKKKHDEDAKYGWYRYVSKFGLPVYNDSGEVERYNIFRVELLLRHASDNRLYLYDLVNIKKETSTPFEQMLYGNKPISFL